VGNIYEVRNIASMTTERIKAHFEEEAKEFDIIIQKLIPGYNEMIDALVSIVPFSQEDAFSVIDLGCGTGTVARSVKDRFPNVSVTCVDIAEKMLRIAEKKIGGDVRCIHADLNSFDFAEKYDLIVSSLALHHLESDDDKLAFYKKVYSALPPNGLFINIDVVLGSSEELQSVYMKKWIEFMSEKVSAEEIAEKWLPNYYAEDRPTGMIRHLEMLKSCGFSCVDVVCKHYNFAVYCAEK
jgi:tRNA (cmo5U34)-methyltransferase